jgi:integrase
MSRSVEGPWFRKSKDAWYATVSGRKVSLGVRGKANRKAAQEAWHRLMAGGPPTKAEPEPAPTRTVAEVIDTYLRHQEAKVKAETLRWLKRWLIPFKATHGNRRADAVAPHELEAFADRPGWKPNTRVHAVRTVHGAFRWAVRKRLLPIDPLAGVEAPPTESRGAEHVISPAEHVELTAHAWPEFRPLLEALFLTGARPGELAGLTCEVVRASANGIVVLADHKTKHKGKRRALYLSDEARALFDRLADRWQTGLLFRNRYGRKWTADAIGKAMRATCERAKLPPRHAYGYRHTFATDALAKGVPDATVAALLGHSNTTMLHRHYSHLTAQAGVLRQAAALVRPAGEPDDGAAADRIPA